MRREQMTSVGVRRDARTIVTWLARLGGPFSYGGITGSTTWLACPGL